MFNEIIVIGKLANEPVLKETSNGVKLATMVLDVERPYRNNLGIKDHDYISCVLWKGISQTVMDCCEIGSYIGIKGRLQSKTFESSDHQTTTVMEVKVEHVEFVDKYLMNR
ncbi:single-stranded DNA-binding protein [Candidatus Stoquefichus sp. SB1]|jgi:single-strand DNA-binding protein|uniref:single-stranded DNA-binding protein n=1 Tax=Candidatus Stoquefichus sp. SB1 TaxID=1658109 RepID=UPI00067F1819|nr:single-stranded DNA-binding protein [Candidatus Stoquefichus sp. SB1]